MLIGGRILDPCSKTFPNIIEEKKIIFNLWLSLHPNPFTVGPHILPQKNVEDIPSKPFFFLYLLFCSKLKIKLSLSFFHLLDIESKESLIKKPILFPCFR